MTFKFSLLFFFSLISGPLLASDTLYDPSDPWWDDEEPVTVVKKKKSKSMRDETSDILSGVARDLGEVEEMGHGALTMLDQQGETLGRIENTHDERLVESLKRSSVILHNMENAWKAFFTGDLVYRKKRYLRMLEGSNEVYAMVKVWRLGGSVWKRRILGLKEGALIVYGRILQYNIAQRIPLEKASIREVANHECDDRQFGIEVSYKRKKLLFHFNTSHERVVWKRKIMRYISKKSVSKSTSQDRDPERRGTRGERGDMVLGDGLRVRDHDNLDVIHEKLDNLLGIGTEMGRVIDSQTRQIGRLGDKFERTTDELGRQIYRTRAIH